MLKDYKKSPLTSSCYQSVATESVVGHCDAGLVCVWNHHKVCRAVGPNHSSRRISWICNKVFALYCETNLDR